MKFFIFNIAVIVALGYLVWGDNQDFQRNINKTNIEHSVIAPIKSAIKDAKEKFQDIKNSTTASQESLLQSQISNRSDIKPVKTPNEASPRETSKTKGNNLKKPIINVAKRPIPVMKKPGSSPASEPAVTSPKVPLKQATRKEPESQFMTARERRRELNKLAGEMELLFVDKLNM
jgi:hypothetical protein